MEFKFLEWIGGLFVGRKETPQGADSCSAQEWRKWKTCSLPKGRAERARYLWDWRFV